MDRLPQEIVDDIISHCFIDEIIHPYRPKLRLISRFATVSRRFQYAIERLLFRTIEISNLDNDIQMFESLFSSSPYRRDFIKRMTLRIQLDEYLQRIIRIYYKALDMDQAGLEAFRAVSETLLILSAWTDRQAIRLTISCQTWGKVVHGERSCREAYPSRANIAVHPFSVVAIAKACPKLDDLILAHADPYSYHEFEFLDKWEHPDSKIAFQLPTHNFAKVYIDPPVCFWLAQLMDFVTARYHARFCVTMHNVLNNFVRLDYRGILEPSFFWPYGPSEQAAPFWQGMTYMCLQFEPVKISGEWYFKTGRQIGQCPVQFWRTPEEDVMMPLIEAMCKALDQMPSLKTFQMSCEVIQMSRGGYWRLSYAAPGVPSNFDRHVEIPPNMARVSGGSGGAVGGDADLGSGHDDGFKSSGDGAEASKSSQGTDDSSLDHVRSFPRWLLDAGDWKPSTEILEALQRVGRGIHGQDALISFVPFGMFW
ncbi:hypothetical protein CGLO_14276 [Colletotrichum gloeosporioides Cg-14]|uniref:F-box domain-containing protein n=1 Tax=Colletotrichum gloeosporioides (strain Cg-14) TaxID=1237896 RepID=T0K486_COLGC|nr:hypothetical protein CGLO_14276 [Colletotrichum gloeosporioides Cg-14]